MPEEINRLLTDQLSELLLTPSADADRNLLAESIPPERIRLVGNVMIDSLLKHLALSESSDARERFGVSDSDYAVVTLHRPSNVDDPATLGGILSALTRISRHLPVVFPLHPRTRKNLDEFGLLGACEGRVRFVEPLGYLDFLRLYSGARLVLTDSGGIQEETTALGIPCLTLRENTERPVTIELGTNRVVGTDEERIFAEAEAALQRSRDGGTPRVPPLWDGRTAERILDALLERTLALRPGGGQTKSLSDRGVRE
jgi:UDP-N-acetylglucosamine 2-epimerase (non-hydrolysing)